MTMMRSGTVVAAAVLLAACGGGDGAAANNEAAAAVNDAAPAPLAENAAVPAAATTGGAETQYMLGKWSAMGEDCADTLEFRDDGKVTTPIGDAKWSMAGDKLTIDYGDGSKPTTSTIKQLGADRIEVTTASGRSETQKRC
jgi:hypothetical protein